MLTNRLKMKPDKIYLSLTLLIIITTISWITSCTHKANISDFPEICFERDVLPIFSNNCAISRCHDGGGESRMALNNYADISNTVVPFNPDASRSYQTIIATWSNQMPPSQPLSQENRTIIRLWIEQGARSTVCPQNIATAGGGGDPYMNPLSGVTRMPPAVPSLPAKSDNLKSGLLTAR
jgi:hypothetical protein